MEGDLDLILDPLFETVGKKQMEQLTAPATN